jgi:hypothetical protein
MLESKKLLPFINTFHRQCLIMFSGESTADNGVVGEDDGGGVEGLEGGLQ